MSLDKGRVEAERELCRAQQSRREQEAEWLSVNVEVAGLRQASAENGFAARFRQALGEGR